MRKWFQQRQHFKYESVGKGYSELLVSDWGTVAACVCVLVNCSCALVYPKSGIIVMENILTVSNLEAALIRRNYSLTLAFFV